MILYPDDFVIYKKEKLLCKVSDNFKEYNSDKKGLGVPIIPVGKNFGWWAQWDEIKFCSIEENPEYLL